MKDLEIHPQIEVGTISNTLRVRGELLTCEVGDRCLSARLIEGRFVLVGGPCGEHALEARSSITSPERLLAHWRGYVENATRQLADRAAREIRGAAAEQVLRSLVDRGGLRIIGVPEAFPSAQEEDAVVLRLEIRVPAALVDAAVAAREGSS